MTRAIADVLASFVSRDVAALRESGGLPAGVPVTEIAAELGADPEACARTFLGDPPQEVFWCAAAVAGFEDPVRIWFREGAVVKVEGRWPELPPAELDALGPVDAVGDVRIGASVVPGGLKVWAALGIAAALNGDGSRVVTLALFPATTPEAFRAELAEIDDYRERPMWQE